MGFIFHLDPNQCIEVSVSSPLTGGTAGQADPLAHRRPGCSQSAYRLLMAGLLKSVYRLLTAGLMKSVYRLLTAGLMKSPRLTDGGCSQSVYRLLTAGLLKSPRLTSATRRLTRAALPGAVITP